MIILATDQFVQARFLPCCQGVNLTVPLALVFGSGALKTGSDQLWLAQTPDSCDETKLN
jgi:hypothetical protein